MAGLRLIGVAAGLLPNGTTSGPIGLRVRGAPRTPWLTGPPVLRRGLPGPLFTGVGNAVGVNMPSPVFVKGNSVVVGVKLASVNETEINR